MKLLGGDTECSLWLSLDFISIVLLFYIYYALTTYSGSFVAVVATVVGSITKPSFVNALVTAFRSTRNLVLLA